jgi:uncharacterized protein YndB with AHSA1/START domain
MVVERLLEAPVEVVWSMWTEPAHFAAWYGPEGAKVTVTRMDVRVGGIRLVGMEMQTPAGAIEMWFAGEFREVVPHALLAYTEWMADRDGNAMTSSAAGMPAEHPATTEIRVELEDLGGRTRMVLTHFGIRADSPGAAGWTMALDKLAARLAA